MPKRYPLEFRRAVSARLIAGERVVVLAEELGGSQQTLYLWKKQH
jgi:transposase-like protein